MSAAEVNAHYQYNPNGYNSTAGISCTGITKNDEEASFKDKFGDGYSNVDNGFGGLECASEYASYLALKNCFRSMH